MADNFINRAAKIHLLTERAAALLKHKRQAELICGFLCKIAVISIKKRKRRNERFRLLNNALKRKIGFCLDVAKLN